MTICVLADFYFVFIAVLNICRVCRYWIFSCFAIFHDITGLYLCHFHILQCFGARDTGWLFVRFVDEASYRNMFICNLFLFVRQID